MKLCLAFLDVKPSDPNITMTAMVRVQELTFETGQRVTLLTCDQQLYQVQYKLFGHSLTSSQKYTCTSGGMHALISFIRVIGSLIAESGMSGVLT